MFVRTVVEVLPAWLVARAVVLASLGLAHATVATVRPHNPGAAARVHQGLLAWDAGWYVSIARHGYVSSGVQSVRFFPVYPFAARVLGWVPGMGVGPALVLLANLCALAAMAALVVLVRSDLGDAALARRSVWLLALAPAAYSLVLGYADAALLLCAIVTVLATRKSRWWWAAATGLLAGGLRPLGLLLVVPVVIEAWRTRRDRRSGMRWIATGAAVLAPLAGTGAYLGWVGARIRRSVASAPGPAAGRAPRPARRTLRRDVAQRDLGRSTATTWGARCTSPGWCCASCCWSWRSPGCRSPTVPSPPRCSRSRSPAPTSIPSSATRSAPSRW